MERVVVGMSGGSGPILGVRLLEVLAAMDDVESHLVASPAAVRTLDLESEGRPWNEVKELADVVHDHRDIAASISSGSFRHRGMAIVPASMNTVSSLAHGIASNLLTRAADVTLKERRNLIVVPRETPLHLGHLRSLTTLAELGACIIPPLLAFYHQPKTVEDLVDHVVGKVIDQLGFEQQLFPPWRGPVT